MKIIYAICFILFPFVVSALDDKNAPVNIKSQAMQIDYGQGFAKYSGEVFVKQNSLTIKCDTMTIYYGDKGKSGSDSVLNAGAIKKIDFDNNVLVSKDGKIAKGDFGVFNPKTQKIILRGNASLKDGKSYLKGETVVYNTATRIFNVTNNKPNEKGRVKVFISEDQVNG